MFGTCNITLTGRCCGIIGVVGNAGGEWSLRVMETELSCVSPGSHCGDGEWGEEGMVIETSSDGVRRVRTLSPSDDKGRSCLELEISAVEGEQRSAGEQLGRGDKSTS